MLYINISNAHRMHCTVCDAHCESHTTYHTHAHYIPHTSTDYLHSVGIAHNNIRCENLLLDNYLSVRLTDFTHASPSRTKTTGQSVRKWAYRGQGSPIYSAPEILKVVCLLVSDSIIQ